MKTVKEPVLSLYLSRRKQVKCKSCGFTVKEGNKLLAFDEKSGGVCEKCANLSALTLLKPGDVAMTRRSKKHSSRTVVVLTWNNRRKRYDRLGQLVEPLAIERARLECEADKEKREAKQKKDAVKRVEEDKIYRAEFAVAIRQIYPSMPKGREVKVADHACEKYSGRVGRTAKAKEFDEDMINRAVIAHIRHSETGYDNMFGRGQGKREIRSEIRGDIDRVLSRWRVRG